MERNKLEPHKIGILVDMPGFPGASDMFPLAVQFALDEAAEEGLVDRPVETILNEHVGQPYGDGWASRNAYVDMVKNHNVLAVAGPFTTDNSLAILDLVEELHVPSITICGTQDYVGKYAFNTSNGNLADEPAYMAAWLKSNGYNRVAVVRDYPSRIGTEYFRFFEFASQMFGIEILLTGNIYPSPSEEDVTKVMARMKAAGPDALVYLGFGEACRELNNGLRNVDWWPPRIMTTAFVQATYHEFFANLIDGWHGIDQYDERNTRFTDMLARYKAKKKGVELAANSASSSGYDIGRCIALALSRMDIATPEAVAAALETIRMMPTMTGGPKTYITFGPYDHRGFKGLDYLNVRKATDGKTVRQEFEFGQ